MPFAIVQHETVNMNVDAIVNTADSESSIAYGCNARFYQKAGLQLLKQRKKIGTISLGDAAVTPAYDLKAKYVIHVAEPIWIDGMRGEEALLRHCYDKALTLALKNKCESIAFPLLASENHGFTQSHALQIAIAAFRCFLIEHEMQIYLVISDRDSFKLPGNIVQSVASFIDKHYIQENIFDEYSAADNMFVKGNDLYRIKNNQKDNKLVRAKLFPRLRDTDQKCAAMAVPVEKSLPEDLDDILQSLDAGFSETLLQLIDRSGKSDVEIYKKANIDRKLFSKIRSNPTYKPSKNTALAFAIALELDLDETKDFLARAGFALSHSSKTDLIVEYFILQNNYDMFTLNEVLFHYDLPTLGG